MRFLQAKYKSDFFIPKDFEKKVKKAFGDGKKKLGLFCAVQFLDNLIEVEVFLKAIGYEVVKSKPSRASKAGQILGCDSYAHNLNMDLDSIDGFVYVGDGYFHPNALLFVQENRDRKIPVVVLNVRQDKVEFFDVSSVEKYFKKRKGNLMKFYSSDVIGVFVSSKWGQEFKDSALKLKGMYPEKSFYFFAGDNFLEFEFENFNFVECFVNTACPRIGQDDVLRHSKPVVNIADIWKLEFQKSFE